MTRYIALTIGPIIKTLEKARKTRELWAASYFFSYLMKQIIQELKNKGHAQFIIPYTDDPECFQPGKNLGAGLFPDRLILKSDTLSLQELNEIVSSAIHELADNICEKEKEACFKYLMKYLRLAAAEKQLDESDKPIREMNKILDVLELQSPVLVKEEEYLNQFMFNEKDPSRLYNSCLALDGFGKKIERFRSIPDIAVSSLIKENIIKEENIKKWLKHEEEEKIYNELLSLLKNQIMQHHKYICIVQADGDNVGKAIEKLKADEYPAFSKALFEFALGSVKMINDFGGVPVYAGGDDLLFFAPVIGNPIQINTNNNGKTILHLVDALNNSFKDKFMKVSSAPSLSFGISVSYYKYPLNEARATARDLLFDRAKDKKIFPNKEAIALKVLKHSGQEFSFNYSLSSEPFKNFTKMINDYVFSTGEINDSFLNSVHHKLNTLKSLIQEVYTDKKRLENIRTNFFNESIHTDAGTFLDKVIDLMAAVFNDASIQITFEERMKIIYGSLRFIQFLRTDYKETER